MTDVRLTAVNPEDSQVYPVACNDKGELLLQFEAQSGKANDGPPVFGTRATLGVLADLVDLGVSYAFGNSPAGTVARISLKALNPND